MQDPDGQEGFRLGGWFRQFGGADLAEWTRVEAAEALRAPWSNATILRGDPVKEVAQPLGAGLAFVTYEAGRAAGG